MAAGAIAVDWGGDAFLLRALLPADTEVVFLGGLLSVQNAMTTFFTAGYHRHNALHDALALRQGFLEYLEVTPRG